MRTADHRHLRQYRSRVDFHAAGAEDQRLDNQRRRRIVGVAAICLQFFQRSLFRSGFREGQGADIEQQWRIGMVEHAARADRHRADRVAMIAVLHHQDLVARLAAIVPIAQRHFQRDLDRRRAAVGKENMGERFGQKVREALGQRARRRMGPAGKDDLVQPGALLLDRSDDFGVAMSMGLHPPAGDGINNLCTVRAVQRRALGSRDFRNRFAQTVLGKRVPDIEAHGIKSATAKLASKAAVRVAGDRWSMSGNRPSRLTSPNRQMVCSLSACFGPTKAMP